MGIAEEHERLEKEVRVLRKTVARMEKNRVTLESMWDRNSNLFRKLNEEIEQQKHVIEDQNERLELLAGKLAKYLSPQVYESIFAGEKEVRIETYRKNLTVFFSDMVEFTPRCETLAPSELGRWLNDYLNEMAEICLRYEGTLDKFIGDAVMVFFGDPKSLGEKEDAVQCVSMALEMSAAAQRRQILIRIGIDSGECIVGNFGSEARMDYTVVGRRVNTAARLETASAPGRILVSAATWELVKDSFEALPNDVIKLKGIEEPIMTWWIESKIE